MKKYGSVAILTALFLCVLMTAWAEEAPVDAPYSEADMAVLTAYLDTDSNGTLINPTYTPDDPETFGVVWNERDGEMRVTDIEWSGMQISGALSLAGLDCLETLDVSRNTISRLDVSGCGSLTSIYCDGNQIEALLLAGCGSLVDLCADNNLLAELDLSDCSGLESLFLNGNRFTSFVVSDMAALKLIQMDGNLLSALTVSGCPLLESLCCESNSLPFLNLGGCSFLKTLCARDNLLLAVNLSGCDSITNLDLANNRLTALPDWSAFEYLTVETTDLSGNALVSDALLNLPEALQGETQWISARSVEKTGEDAPARVSGEEPDYDLTSLGSIMTNRQGTVFEYDPANELQEEGWSLTVAARDNDGSYYQRNLVLTEEMLQDLQAAGYFEVALQMNDVTIYVPIGELLDTQCATYTVLVAPMAKDEWNDVERAALSGSMLMSTACRFRILGQQGNELVNVTHLVDGLKVRVKLAAAEAVGDMRLFLLPNQEGFQAALSNYVPEVSGNGEYAVYTADISGAGSGLTGLAAAE